MTQESQSTKEFIMSAAILIENRIRKDLGDIPGLAKSIQENGLIEPIVLKRVVESDLSHVSLVAGERRLTALKSLGIGTLEYGVHYVWREDLRENRDTSPTATAPDPKIRLLATAIEIEENVRRKELSWQEQVLGKQKLLKIMQEIHGIAQPGAPTAAQRSGSQPTGFGVRKLATMLGESPEQTSNDLELANMITIMPALKLEASREAAKRKLDLAVKTIAGTATSANVAQAYQYKIVITCDDEAHQKHLLEQFRKVGIKCVPVVA